MALGFGASAAVADTASTTSRAITIPVGATVGQTAWIAGGYNPTTDTTTPAGWTVAETIDFSATFRGRLYSKVLAPGDPGAVVTFANATAQRQGYVIWVPTGANGSNVDAGLAETTPGTAHANATAVSTAAGGQLIFFVERSTTPSTTAAPGGTWTARASAFGVGSGSVSVAVADKVAVTSSGTTVGTATWTADVSNSAIITFVVGVTQSTGGVAVTNTRTLQYHMNRLAGTLVNGVPSRDAQGAANIWAGTTGLDIVHALNVKAGNTLAAGYKEIAGVLNQLAGTSGLEVDGAAASIP